MARQDMPVCELFDIGFIWRRLSGFVCKLGGKSKWLKSALIGP